jgi:hypothetical protein
MRAPIIAVGTMALRHNLKATGASATTSASATPAAQGSGKLTVDGVEACLDTVLAQARNDGLLVAEAGLIGPSEMGLRFLNLLVERFDLS